VVNISSVYNYIRISLKEDIFPVYGDASCKIKYYIIQQIEKWIKIMVRYYNLFKTFKNWWIYLAYKYGLAETEQLVFETRNGVIVEVPIRLLQTFKEIFMDECYLTGLERPIPAGAAVVDIGANAGYFSLFAASRFTDARIFSFEPVPVNYVQLERHRNLNSSRQIKCFPQAVAGKAGEISLAFDSSDSFTTSATIFAQNAAQREQIKVPCLTLGQVMDENGINKCDLLKMDCEGAEYEILYNCPAEYLQRIDQIAMEVHRGEKENQNITALEAFFQQQGFFTRRRPVGMLWAWRRA
jgi:FkbM family methyltransferase